MDLERIYEQVAAAGKAKYIWPDTIRRLCRVEAAKYKQEKQVIKAVKGKLHQMNSAYVGKAEHDKALNLVRRLTEDAGSSANLELCRQLLQLHASTAERLAIYDDFYRRLFAYTGRPSSLLDIACGFNPFSLPWMRLEQNAEYFAADINLRTIELINLFLERIHAPGRAFAADALEFPPFRRVDLALMFKLLPLLEKQEKGSSRRLIDAVNARFVAVAFPVRSLSGKSLNMLALNTDLFENQIAAGMNYQQLLFPDELVYIIDKGN